MFAAAGLLWLPRGALGTSGFVDDVTGFTAKKAGRFFNPVRYMSG